MTKDDLAYFKQRCENADDQFAAEFSSREMKEAIDEIKRLQAFIAGRPDGNATTSKYRLAISSEGPLAAQWIDKPHRLVYDLCGMVEQLQAEKEGEASAI